MRCFNLRVWLISVIFHSVELVISSLKKYLQKKKSTFCIINWVWIPMFGFQTHLIIHYIFLFAVVRFEVSLGLERHLRDTTYFFMEWEQNLNEKSQLFRNFAVILIQLLRSFQNILFVLTQHLWLVNTMFLNRRSSKLSCRKNLPP